MNTLALDEMARHLDGNFKTIGLDLVYLPRITCIIEHYGDAFMEKVLTSSEQAYCQSSRTKNLMIKRLGGRIAAKEAVSKALGVGFSLLGYPDGVTWRSIEVVHAGQNHRPSIVLHQRTQERAESLGLTQWLISITHDGDYAMAFVMAC